MSETPAETDTAGPHDIRQWHISQYNNNRISAINPDSDDDAIATALTPNIAEQIVAEHALCTTPYADDDHRGGSWVQLLGQLTGENIRLRRLVAEHGIEVGPDG